MSKQIIILKSLVPGPTGPAGPVSSVGVVAPAAGITSAGGPITSAGNITLALANDLAAVEGLGSIGLARRTNTDTWDTVTAPTGTVVGTSDAQTLTNKTITGAGNTISGITESMLSFSDVTTLNVTTTQHGFAPKLPNDVTKFLNGIGTYTVPAGGGGGVTSITAGTGLTGGTVTSTGTFAVDTSVVATLTAGVVTASLLGTGSSITTKFLRGDNTWQVISGGGDALTTNPLSQFASTTSAQLAGVLSDEVGSGGGFVRATAPTITTLTTAGIVTGDGARVLTGTAITSHVIDVTKIDNFESISANTTYTFSGTPAASNTVFGAKITTDGTARTLTIPSSISAAQNGATITSIIVPASTTVFLQWFYDGTNYQISGDPVLTTGTGATYVLAGSPTITTPTIAKLANLTSNGIVTTSGGDGTLSITGTSGSGNVVLVTSATLITPTLGVATVTTVNKLTITAPATSATLTVADGKTLTVSNTVTLAGTDSTVMTLPPASASLGYLGAPQNSQSTAYTTVLADSGKCLFHPVGDNNARTFTIDSNANVAFPVGTLVEFLNMAAASVTIAITSDTLTLLPAGTTGSRTLAQYGRAVAEKITSTSWVISGNSALT